MSLVARRRRTVRRRDPRHPATGAEGAGRRVPPAPRSAPNSGSRTALQKHVDFFDTNHDGKITLPDTYHDADGDGALDGAELTRLLAGNRTDLVGHLGSKAEFGLLLELAGEDHNGRKVLTRERLERFYNGSLLYQLAEEVAARRASEQATPRGAVKSGIRAIY
jgi:hypothetical protein